MGLMLLLGVIYYALRKDVFLPVLLAVSVFFICSALFMPVILAPFNRGWARFSELLGILNTWIILTLLYFVIITPLGLLMKIFGKDTLKLKIRKEASTYWEKGSAVQGSSIQQQF